MAKSLDIVFKGRDDGVISTMKEQGASADQLKAKYKELADVQAAKGGPKGRAKVGVEVDEGEAKQGIARINELFGRSSQLGQIGKLIRGGGAVFAVNEIAKAVEAGTDRAKEMVAQFRDGKSSALGIAEGVVESLPVIGNVYKAFHSVADLLAQFPSISESWIGKLTGLSSLKMSETIKQTEEVRKILLDSQAESIQKQIRLTRELADVTATTNRKVATLGMDEGFGKEDAGRKDALADKRQAMEDKRADAVAEAEKQRKAAAEALDKQADLTIAQRFEGRQQLQQQYRQNVARINKDYDQLESNEVRMYWAEEGAATAKAHREAIQQVEDYQRTIRDIDATSNADRLKILGFTADAELAIIRKSNEDKRAEIDKRLKEQLKGANGEYDKAQLQQAADQEKQALNRQEQMAEQNTRYTAQKAARNELAEIQISLLQREGAAGDVLAVTEAKRLQAAKQTADEEEKLNRIANDGALTADQRIAAQQALGELKRAQAADATKSLKDEHQSLLQTQATYGATYQERREAEKQLIAERLSNEFKAREAQVASILANKSATDQQRKQAQADLEAYAQLAGRAYDKETRGKERNMRTDFNAEENVGGLSGVAASARQRYDPAKDQVQATKEGNKIAADMKGELTKLVAALTNKPKEHKQLQGIF